MLPAWGRLVTAVKLNRGLKQSNYDHIYAYLKQHKAHANENKMMLERYNQHAIDPLVLMSNVLPHQYLLQSPVVPQSAYVPSVNYQPQFAANTQPDLGFTSTDDLIENLTKTGRQNRGQENYARGAVASRNEGVQNRVETMFMANLLSADPIYDEAGPSYDLDSLSEVQDHDKYVDSVVKTTHAPAVVHDSEDTLEIAEKTRIGMLEKMKSTLWVDKGERGFEQTKECYLTEVIPFFKTLKEHFEGIQTALVKEVKEMKEIFEQMEAEVEQNDVDKQCADIERKNLLIQNENLIANWLSNEVLYSVMNDGNTVSKFSEMHDAYTIE
ncbi:hypothetical protein Tco_0214723 [Tanacetum coccineum]